MSSKTIKSYKDGRFLDGTNESDIRFDCCLKDKIFVQDSKSGRGESKKGVEREGAEVVGGRIQLSLRIIHHDTVFDNSTQSTFTLY